LWLRAERQTDGRGRQGRHWHSPAGNLYASTLVRLRPGDPPPATLAMVAAVALHEILSAYAPGRIVLIKWPNDLLVEGRKISGVLLERVEEAVVIGMGVNLASHPQDIDRPATSLAAIAGLSPDPADFWKISPAASSAGSAAGGAKGLPRSAPAGLPRHIRSAPRLPPVPERDCSRAWMRRVRCGFAWRTARPVSFTPVTSS
jgi:BirA family biotin operon repressor/biotin-[acetyl-CoA-carboxylase] ligase